MTPPTERKSTLGPEPQPVAATQVMVPQETFASQLNEILNPLRAQQSQIAGTHTVEQEQKHQQADVGVERNRAVQEQEERIRALEAGLDRTCEELEQKCGTCRMMSLDLK